MTKEREPLKLDICYAILENLGISLYQKPVDVISELVANAWDADATEVQIEIDSSSKTISVSDNGIGMTYEDCQSGYLQAGRNRRVASQSDTTAKGRKVLGRKGIGKFAGFGITEKILVTTCSAQGSEVVSFALDASRMDPNASVTDVNIVTDTTIRDRTPADQQGTSIRLEGCRVVFENDAARSLRTGLSRRFVLDSLMPPGDSFSMFVNSRGIDTGFEGEHFEYLYPRDLTLEQRGAYQITAVTDDGWAVSEVDGNRIEWRLGFYEKTIDDPELQGVSIFARGKLAQAPFFFDRAGGSSSDFASAYMTGQMRMDFVDDDMNLISPERQRINFDDPRIKGIKQWGQKTLDGLSRLRKESKTSKRTQELFSKDGRVGKRLATMGKTEQRQLKNILTTMAAFPALSKSRCEDWGLQVINAFENGRLYLMMEELSSEEEFDDSKLFDILKEAGMLTDLQVAEAIKTKILVIAELKKRVGDWENENSLRDYIAQHPWLVSPELETALKETSLLNTIKRELGTDDLDFDPNELYQGRIDLLLKTATTYTLVEFMKPGKRLDFDHVNRIERYVVDLARHLEYNSGYHFGAALVVADVNSNPSLAEIMRDREKSSRPIRFRSWDAFLNDCESIYREQIAIYKERNAGDERIESL